MSIGESSTGFERLRDLAAEIVQHWVSECLVLAGQAKVKLLPTAPRLTEVRIEIDEIIVTRSDKSQSVSIPLHDDLAGRSPVSLLARELNGSAAVAVIIPQQDVLRPSLRMPKASNGVLRKALQFELSRLSPIPADQLYFDFEIAGHASARSDCDIKLRAVRKSTVDGAVARCRAAGALVAGIGFAGETRLADWRVFPVDRKAFVVSQARRWSLVGLCGLAVTLFLLLLIAVYIRGEATVANLQAQIDSARTGAVVARHLRSDIETLARAQTFLVAQKRKPMLVAILAELSRILPDDTWISEFEVNGRRVRIQGASRSASRLVGLIDGSGSFANAQFEAPLTQDQTGKSEHFDMSFQVLR
jgi:general secretion pathway protein L